MSIAIDTEIDRNFDFFQRNMARFLPDERGKFALLRHGKVVRFYATARDAEHAGVKKFPDDLFSIQEVTSEPVDLGFFTHAFNNG